MSVLASGAIPAEEAIRWICERPQIESIVFGASSRGNIVQTKQLIDKYSVGVQA
jgi:predicted aldo/keto reductase-like oxidoreductase